MTLTIFTPTYNRGSLLDRLYQSLITQNRGGFEWLIVDDGSTDNTSDVVEQFIKEEKIAVRYIYKENGGKHTAYNVAVENALGDLFLCLDSDDFLAPNAVEIIQQSGSKLRDTDCGFIAYKQDTKGKLLSAELPIDENMHCGLFQYEKKHKIAGEFAFVFKRDVIRNYAYPVFPNERFIGECVLYDRLEMGGYTFCPLKEVLEICEYQPEGLSNDFGSLMKKNPAGYCLYFMQRIDMQYSWKDRIITAGKYKCFCMFSGKNRSAYRGKHRVLAALCTPIGFVFWVYYKLLRGF
ncbi:MAG: glycosyltransferase family 2 protein [Faecousia sp.]